MSLNQTSADKTQSVQYPKTGRSSSSSSGAGHRNYAARGGGGGANSPPPPLYSNRSFKKASNVQGVQTRVTSGSVNLDPSNNAALPANAAHSQSHGGADAQVGVKPAVVANVSAVSSSTMALSTPVKGGGFLLQSGSISPGLMQVPAQTSSAPPNLDEQKREQARYDSSRAAPVLPTQSIPKQHGPTNKSVTADQSSAVNGHSMSKARRDVQVTAGPHTIETQKPAVHPVNGMPMQMPFQPGGNFGVLKNPRAQIPVMHSGVQSGPVQYMNQQYGMQRTNSDAERWQRTNSFQRGLIPSPRTPVQVMHKAERKYEVGKVTDEEQAKQRQLKGILNKLTPQNFERLFEQVKQVNIDNAGTLTGVISQIFDKALMEPTFCEMYANFCYNLAGELPAFNEDNEKITFKRLLINKCQMEFERGEREQEEANRADGEGETKQSDEEREEKRVQARRRMLGNIRLLGELYKKKMLTERIMHECIKKLLGQYQNPDEENIEALCKLMSTIGEMIDHPKAKEHQRTILTHSILREG